MDNPYSDFSSVSEFLDHTQGISRRDTLQLASNEIGSLKEVAEARLGVKKSISI